MKGKRILVDTMVIIEAHRMGVWNALCTYYAVETVEQCVGECATGDKLRTGYVPVDTDQLRARIKVHTVTPSMVAALLLADPEAAGLDDGEKELLSFAMTQPNAWLLCDPDKAAIRSTFRLNLMDRVVALESLAVEAGVRKGGYGLQHTKAWLSAFKTKVQLGMLYKSSICPTQ